MKLVDFSRKAIEVHGTCEGIFFECVHFGTLWDADRVQFAMKAIITEKEQLQAGRKASDIDRSVQFIDMEIQFNDCCGKPREINGTAEIIFVYDEPLKAFRELR
mmetsp:Transcript_20358/g.31801  ORF Transcript_20358/g.31801 Transcript_20358/m.31801 type:complete len:104 (-) Transcript_20358:8-319(-)